jgi:hypothetical protein
VRKKETMRWRKALMKELGFFYLGQACFIYKHVLTGLWSGKAQSVLLGFYSANSIEELTYQGKRCVQKKEQGLRKYLSRSTSAPRFRLGGLRYKEGRNPLQRQIKSANDARRNMEQVYLFFLSLYPKLSATVSGATPIGSAIAHLIRKKVDKRKEANRSW